MFVAGYPVDEESGVFDGLATAFYFGSGEDLRIGGVAQRVAGTLDVIDTCHHGCDHARVSE